MKKLLSIAGVLTLALSLEAANAQVMIAPRMAPPPSRRERIPPRMVNQRGWVWQPGFYRWQGGRYVWIPGSYVMPPRPRAIWVPGRWRNTRRGWVWVDGHWR